MGVGLGQLEGERANTDTASMDADADAMLEPSRDNDGPAAAPGPGGASKRHGNTDGFSSPHSGPSGEAAAHAAEGEPPVGAAGESTLSPEEKEATEAADSERAGSTAAPTAALTDALIRARRFAVKTAFPWVASQSGQHSVFSGAYS